MFKEEMYNNFYKKFNYIPSTESNKEEMDEEMLNYWVEKELEKEKSIYIIIKW